MPVDDLDELPTMVLLLDKSEGGFEDLACSCLMVLVPFMELSLVLHPDRLQHRMLLSS